MATNTKGKQGELAQTTEATLARFQDMAMMIPEVDGSGAELRIVEQIMSATSLSELDAPWQEKDMNKLVGEWLSFESVERSESTHEGSLGLFLVVHAVRLDTGEAVTFSTGSVSIVAQIVQAYTLGQLPFRARIVKSERASKSGFFPQHLEFAK